MHVCVTGDRPRHSHSHSHLNEIRRYHFGLSSAFLKRAAWYVTILTTNAARVQFPRQVFSPQAPRPSSMRSRRYHFGLSSAFLKRAAWYVTILTTNAARVQFPRQVFSPQAPRASSMRSPKVEVLLLMGDGDSSPSLSLYQASH